MANKPEPQPEIGFCPKCKEGFRNVPRDKMKSNTHVGKGGTISEHTHTYECPACRTRFEINQDR